MVIYCIYKTYLDSDGEEISVDIVECDEDEVNAQRFSKLYNLQLPKDLKSKMAYNYMPLRVM